MTCLALLLFERVWKQRSLFTIWGFCSHAMLLSLTKLFVAELWTRGKIRVSLIWFQSVIGLWFDLGVLNWSEIPNFDRSISHERKYSPALMSNAFPLVCVLETGAKCTVLKSVLYEDKQTKRTASVRKGLGLPKDYNNSFLLRESFSTWKEHQTLF